MKEIHARLFLMTMKQGREDQHTELPQRLLARLKDQHIGAIQAEPLIDAALDHEGTRTQAWWRHR